MATSFEPRLVSYDVFDTVVTRRVGNPESAFYLLGQRLRADGRITCSPSAFTALRREAESRCRQRTQGGEPHLIDIWRELAWYCEWPAGTWTEFMALELAVERSLLVALPGITTEIEAWRRKNTTIRFVSDTYFDARTLGDLLEHVQVHAHADECWTSSDHRRSKRFGGLFKAVLAASGIEAGRAVHIGNDPAIDGRGSRAARMHTEIRPAGNLTYFERELEGLRDQTDGLSSIVAGAARLARLSVAQDGVDDAGARLAEVAAGVVGPVLTAYVLWLMRDAAASGLTRLYFVSRDGQVLKALAEQLRPLVPASLELRYLYGGRLAWVLPAMREPAEAFEWLMAQSDTTDVGHGLTRLGLSASRITEWLALARIGDGGGRAESTAAFLQFLRSNPAVRDEIRDSLAELRASTVAYLRQEGVGDSTCRSAMVDIGWKGSLYASLQELLGSGQPETAYHFGLVPGLPRDLTQRIKPYLFDTVSGSGYGDLGRRAALLVETFCAGSEGVAMGINSLDGAWRPRCATVEDTPAVAWGVRLVHRTVAEFGRELAVSGLVSSDADFRPIAASLIAALWDRPRLADAQSWGRYPLADGPGGMRHRPLAAPYGVRHVMQAAFRGHVDLPHSTAWPAASRLITETWVLRGMEWGAGSRERLSALRGRMRRHVGRDRER